VNNIPTLTIPKNEGIFGIFEYNPELHYEFHYFGVIKVFATWSDGTLVCPSFTTGELARVEQYRITMKYIYRGVYAIVADNKYLEYLIK
jgi:hypothetical protein